MSRSKNKSSKDVAGAAKKRQLLYYCIFKVVNCKIKIILLLVFVFMYYSYEKYYNPITQYSTT